jgi:hypothetical protein
MIPYSSSVATRVRPSRQFRLWIPFGLVWVLLLPVVLLFAPLVFLGCLLAGVGPLRGVWVYGQLFNALRGLRLEVEDPRARIRIL